jgi:oxygen-independent coproporphyrinogen-3 oxidase
MVFKERFKETYVYPKICIHQNSIKDKKTFFDFYNRTQVAHEPSVLYIHIPFCDAICFYCSYYKVFKKKTSFEERSRFTDCIVKEIEMYAKFDYFRDFKISTVQFGGGTPTSIEIELIERIINAINTNFDMTESKVISMEGNVMSLQNHLFLEQLKQLGVNRLSFGIQTFNPAIRKKLAIKAKIQEIYRAVELINEIGFSDFSVDLMYNLPDQEMSNLEYDIDEVVKLNPFYIDVYPLVVFPNTKFKNIIERSNLFKIKPNNENEVMMFRYILKRMRESGYKQVKSFTFSSKYDVPSLNSEIYLKCGPIIGIGPSARTYSRQAYYRNVVDIENYIMNIENDELPAEAGLHITELEHAHRIMVFFPYLTKIGKKDILKIELFKEQLDLLSGNEYIEETCDGYRLTDKGLLWTGNISKLFFSHDEELKMTKSFFYTLKDGRNPYNQDYTGVAKR